MKLTSTELSTILGLYETAFIKEHKNKNFEYYKKTSKLLLEQLYNYNSSWDRFCKIYFKIRIF